MNKKIIITTFSLIIIVIGLVISFTLLNIPDDDTNTISGTIIDKKDTEFTIQDSSNIIYTFDNYTIDASVGSSVIIEYMGIIDKDKSVQSCEVVNYDIKAVDNSNKIPDSWRDNGIFKAYYQLAYDKMKSLSIDERIGQIFLVRYSSDKALSDLEKYGFSGFVFYEKDFKDKTETDVKNMINVLQKKAKIPLLTAVDEEGGSVVRVSSNSELASEKFKSPSELYQLGGFPLIKEDTINKSKILYNFGLNLNLAPVVDVATVSSAYMYNRTLKENTDLTNTYAKTVIEASKKTGVSYTLKHFPGYGNNADTHGGVVNDTRTYDDLVLNDLPPFKAGISAGAEAVLVGHNIVSAIDMVNPASISSSVHNLLRNNLNFTGIIITDDLDMGAVNGIDNASVKAIFAGNDLIISTNYEEDIANIKRALDDGIVSEDLINKLAFRVLSWKYYKGLMFDNQK